MQEIRKCDRSLSNPKTTVLETRQEMIEIYKALEKAVKGTFHSKFFNGIFIVVLNAEVLSIVPGDSFHDILFIFSSLFTSVIWSLRSFDRESAKVNLRDN